MQVFMKTRSEPPLGAELAADEADEPRVILAARHFDVACAESDCFINYLMKKVREIT